MKKFLILLVLALCITTTTTIAQNRVRGVETKLVTYEGPSYSYTNTYSRNCTSYEYSSWFGYSFYNMNSIPVSVDAKLYEVRGNGNTLVTTKSFVLESKESYIWKFEANAYFRVYEDYNSERTEPRGYYVEYEGYKLE